METFKFTASTAGEGTYARRSRNYGGSFPSSVRINLKLYCDKIDTYVNKDYFELVVYLSAGLGFRARFASDGLFIFDGTTDNEIGTSLVTQDTWQTWSFDIDYTSSEAKASCSVYIDDILQANSVDCSWLSKDSMGFAPDAMGFDEDEFGFQSDFVEGGVVLTQYVDNTDNAITYMDYLQVQTGSVRITSWEVGADKSALMAASFTGKVSGRLALQ